MLIKADAYRRPDNSLALSDSTIKNKFFRCDSGYLVKDSREVALVAEAQLQAYVCNWGLAFAKQPLRLPDPRTEKILMWSQANGLPEKPAEGIRTHLHVVSQFLQPQILSQLRFNIFNGLAQPPPRHACPDLSDFCRPRAIVPGQIGRE